MNVTTKKLLESLLNKDTEVKHGRSSHQVPSSALELMKAAVLIIKTAEAEIEKHEWMVQQLGVKGGDVKTVCLAD